MVKHQNGVVTALLFHSGILEMVHDVAYGSVVCTLVSG
jgi:hypothetical protein